MKITEVKAKLVEVGTMGRLYDAKNPDVQIKFKSTREELQSRAFKLISDITGLINAKNNGLDYKTKTTYFDRYQQFIDANTTEFTVDLTSTFNVQK